MVYVWVYYPLISQHSLGEHDNMHPPHFLPLDLGTVQFVSDSIPASLFPHGPDWAGANMQGQVESCGWGRSAGVFPVSSPHRSRMDAAWQRATEALRVPLPQRDTRCQSSRALQSPRLLRPVYSTRWCRATFVICCAGSERGTPVALWGFAPLLLSSICVFE